MPTEPLLINKNDANLMSNVDKLQAVAGYCIFIDIVGSTAMKQRSIREWVVMIYNGFVTIQHQNRADLADAKSAEGACGRLC